MEINKFEEGNICPFCGGRLVADNVVLTSYPPKYQAHCEKCGRVFHSNHHIGAIDTVEVESGMWCVEAPVAAPETPVGPADVGYVVTGDTTADMNTTITAPVNSPVTVKAVAKVRKPRKKPVKKEAAKTSTEDTGDYYVCLDNWGQR